MTILLEFFAVLSVALFAGAALYINAVEHPARMGLEKCVAALLVGALVPCTFAVIMPTNQRLLAPGRDLASDETRALLVRWGRPHAVRTLLSLAGALLCLWLVIGT